MYSVNTKHKFTLNDIFFGAEALCILYHQIALLIVVDKISDVATSTFDEFSCGVVLGRNQDERHLFAKVGDFTRELHKPQLSGTAMLLFGSMRPDFLGVVLVGTSRTGSIA